MSKVFFFIFIGIFISLSIYFFMLPQKAPVPSLSTKSTEKTLWNYQCVDTMKTSRDKARLWATKPDLENHIEKEMKAIKAMGGNCVAIDTPYDKEFLPYLTLWVKKARAENLKIWFRGNFSSWEGWFDYPKGMTTETHTKMTKSFILENKNLFEDGDIFTPSPEAENGGPFMQVETDEYIRFRKFLVEEYLNAKDTFKQMNKDVKTNWLSLNGGLGKRMFDKPTIERLDKVVSLDHYVKTPQEMGEYIKYFADTFGSSVVIGEWGAPIPEINGKMSDNEQAAFLDQLLFQMYRYKDHVEGINYWVLYDSSTEIYNKDLRPKPSVNIIKKYFKPAVVKGFVKDEYGNALSNSEISVNEIQGIVKTQENGSFELVLPAGETQIKTEKEGFIPFSQKFSLDSNIEYSRDFILISKESGFNYKIKLLIKNLLRH